MVEDVGRPITEFENIRELIIALRDALKGTYVVCATGFMCALYSVQDIDWLIERRGWK